MDILLWSGFIPRRKEDDQFYILHTTHDPLQIQKCIWNCKYDIGPVKRCFIQLYPEKMWDGMILMKEVTVHGIQQRYNIF